MINIVHVTRVKALDGARLLITFSTGAEGTRDLSDILAEGGPMVEPLRDPALFRRVFVHCGAPTWPNGFDLDAVRLHDEMMVGGLLTDNPVTSGRTAAE